MPHIWQKVADSWNVLPLPDAAPYLLLQGKRPNPKPRKRIRKLPSGGILLAKIGDGVRENWFLIAGESADVRINGTALHAGMAALEDRDFVTVAGGVEWVFGTERLPCIETFDAKQARYCGRCKDLIEAGQQFVRCPGCGALHHQVDAALRCWTYEPRCSQCKCSTRLQGAQLRWNPDEL